MKDKIILGTRGSRLALWQANFVADLLKSFHTALEVEVKIIETTGDVMLETALSKIGDKGLFTRQIEEQLLAGSIDAAIHSLKDLPTTLPANLKIGAVTARETPNDALIAKKYSSIDDLPQGAKVATGSLRRRSQLLNYRRDLQTFEIRGNVPTRIKKFEESDLDAMILAFAGVHRLKLDAHIKQIIPTEIMLPAVAQGVVGIEIRETDAETEKLLAPINNGESWDCISAERSFLHALEGGCQVPIGGFATLENDLIHLSGFTGSLDGEIALRESVKGNRADAVNLGRELGKRMIEKGANRLLEFTRNIVQKTPETVI
ncbi:MAG: hydroxymethylbilane synthase [Acidobacteriota bacterium]|nr:hydroxymethylbilane synthase [Acidobacteriota bacterium]